METAGSVYYEGSTMSFDIVLWDNLLYVLKTHVEKVQNCDFLHVLLYNKTKHILPLWFFKIMALWKQGEDFIFRGVAL